MGCHLTSESYCGVRSLTAATEAEPRHQLLEEAAVWATPVQGEPVDYELRMRGVTKMMAALHAESNQTGSWRTDTLYVPILRGGRSSLSKIQVERPSDADSFPGYTVWRCITATAWKTMLIEFAIRFCFDVIDLQSDVIMSIALFSSHVYSQVPMILKIAFAGLVLLTCLFENLLALREVRQSQAHSKDPDVHTWTFLLTGWFLNWAGASVELQVVPHRWCEYGNHRLARNLGSLKETDGRPLVMVGYTGFENYLNLRVFLPRLPKVFLENLCLFVLTAYIQTKYCDGWTAAAWFSTGTSAISLVAAVHKAAAFLVATWRAKRWMKQAVEDTHGYLSKYSQDWCRRSLTEGFISCPLL